jgi:hypothetical protein
MLELADPGTKPLSSAKVKRGARMPAGVTVQCIMRDGSPCCRLVIFAALQSAVRPDPSRTMARLQQTQFIPPDPRCLVAVNCRN